MSQLLWLYVSQVAQDLVVGTCLSLGFCSVKRGVKTHLLELLGGQLRCRGSQAWSWSVLMSLSPKHAALSKADSGHKGPQAGQSILFNFYFNVLGIEPRASGVPSWGSASELHPSCTPAPPEVRFLLSSLPPCLSSFL